MEGEKEDADKLIELNPDILQRQAKNDKDKVQEVQRKVNQFYKALSATHVLKKPDYIDCPPEDKPHWDAITTMEVDSVA